MRTLPLSLLVTTLASVSNAEVIPKSEFHLGIWVGAAFKNTTNDNFSHCAISAPYSNKDTLYITVSSNGLISFAVESAGESLPVTLHLDWRLDMDANANKTTESAASPTVSDPKLATDHFHREYTLRVETYQSSVEYSLTEAFSALDAVRKCAVKFLNCNSATQRDLTAQQCLFETNNDLSQLGE